MAPRRVSAAAEMQYQRCCTALVRCALLLLFVTCLSSSSLLPRVSAQLPDQCTFATCWIEIAWDAPEYYGTPGECGPGGQVGVYTCTGWNSTTLANNTRPMTDCWNNFDGSLYVPDTTRVVYDWDCVEWRLTTPLTNCSVPCNMTGGNWTRQLECIDTTQSGSPSVAFSYCDKANLTRPNTTTPCFELCDATSLEITSFAVYQDPFLRVAPQAFPESATPAIFVSIPLGMKTRLVITKAYANATATWVLQSSAFTTIQLLVNKGSGDLEAMVTTTRTVAGSDTLDIIMSSGGQSKMFSIGLQWAVSNNGYISTLRILDPSPHMLPNGVPLVRMIDANTYRGLDFNVPNSFVVSQNLELLVDYDITKLRLNFTLQSSFTTSQSNNITVDPLLVEALGDASTTPSFEIKTNADSGSKVTYNFRVRRLAAVPAGVGIWAGDYMGEFAPSNSWSVDNHYNYTVVLPRDRAIPECFLYMPLAPEYQQSNSPLITVRFSVGLLPITDRPSLEALPRYTPSAIQNITLPADFGPRGFVRVWTYIYGDTSCDNNAGSMGGRFCYPFAMRIYSAKFKRVGREASMALALDPAPLQVNAAFQSPCANLSTQANPDVWNCSVSEYTYSNMAIPRSAGLGLSLCMGSYPGGQRSSLEFYQPGGAYSVFNLTLNDDDDASGFSVLSQLPNAPCAAGEVLFLIPGNKVYEGRNRVLFKLASEDASKHVEYTVLINRLPPLPSSSSSTGAADSSSAMSSSSSSSAIEPSSTAAESSTAEESSSAVESSSAAQSSSAMSSSSAEQSSSLISSSSALASSSSSGPASSSSSTADSSSSAGVSSSAAPSSSTSIESSSASVESSSTGIESSSTGIESSTGLFVPPVAVVVAVVPARTDPCTTALNPCLWNSRCESALSPNSTVVADPDEPVSKTMRCSCLPGFFGDGCSIGILTRALTSTPNGNQTMRVIMVGSQAIRALTAGMSHRVIDFTRHTISVANDADTLDIVSNHPSADVRALSSVESLTFTSPSYWELFPTGYTPASYASQSFVSMALHDDYGLPSSRRLLQSSSSTGADGVALPIRSGYQTLRFLAQFSNPSGGTTTRSLNATNLLYYSASNCIEVNGPNSWQMRDGTCGPCPEGCNCVGGGRCWPLPGYWSWNERQLPVACSYPDACPGVNAASMISEDGAINTQTCSAGYTGAGCTQCADSFYELNGRCYSCGSSTDQTAQMAAIIFAAVLVTLSLAVGVVTLSPMRLVNLVTAFVLLQQISVIGAQGANNIPGSAGPALATFFSFISVVNFDLQILRPGCSVPTFSFLTLFLGTLGLILFTAGLFLLACSLRYVFMRALSQNGLILSAHSKLDEASRAEATRRVLEVAKEDPLKAAMRAGLFSISPLEDFRRRFGHSMLILCTIFFLKLTTLQMRLFVCVMAPAPADALTADETTELQLLLKADLQTLCYTGSHLACVLIALALFVIYTLGFPLAVFVLLTRKFADDTTKGIVGALRRNFAILRPAVSKAQERSQARDKLELQEVAAQRTLSTAATMPRAASIATPDKPGAGFAWQTDVRKPSTLRLTSAAGLTPSMQKKLAYLYVEHSRISYFAIFFLDIRTEYFPYRLSTFITNFAFVLVTTLVINVQRQLFALGMVFAFDAVVVSWCLPFTRWTLNLRSGLIAVLLVAQNGVLLGVQNDSSADGGPGSAFFIVLVCVFAMLCVLLAARDPIMRAISRCTGLKIRSSREGPKHTTKVQPYAVKGLRGAGENSSSGLNPGPAPLNEYADSDDDEQDEASGNRVVAVNEHEREVELARVVASEERRARNEAAQQVADSLSRPLGSDLSDADSEDQTSSVEVSRKDSFKSKQGSPLLLLPVAPPSSNLPPSWSFPQDTPIQPSLMLANALSGLTASARTVASASVVAAPGQTGSQVDWATAPLSADDLAASSQQLLSALCADRDATQVALLQAVWKNPVLSSAAEQQLADLVTTVGQLRDDVTSLLQEERAAAAEVKAQAARVAGMQSLVEIRPATPARVEGMVQHLLSKQRPDLETTCVQHLLDHEADFAPQLDDLVRSANEQQQQAAEGAAASSSSPVNAGSSSSSSSSSSIAALSLQQSLTRSGLGYFKSAALQCRPGDSKSLAMYSTVSNRLARNQALLSTAASALATQNFAAADASYAAAGMSRHTAAQGLPALKPRAVTDTAALGFRSFLQQTAASRAKRVQLHPAADSSPVAGSVAASAKPGKTHGRKPSAVVIAAAAALAQTKGSPLMSKPAAGPAHRSPSSPAEIAPPSPEHSML